MFPLNSVTRLMKQAIPVIFCLLLICINSSAQPARTVDSLFVVNGYVKSRQTGEILPGASVLSVNTGFGTITNAYGFFSMTLPAGQQTLRFTYLGFMDSTLVIDLKANYRIQLMLSPKSHNLTGIDIFGHTSEDQRHLPLLGVEKLDMANLRKLPVLFGETDPLKTIQLLPGIAATSEGSTSVSVRGGNPDQNLLQFDEAIVYNGGHLLGFFSIFNNDAIKEVQVYKGDLPAWTGGRLSSLIDIRSRDGNMNHLAGMAGIGLISSKVTIEGPMVKNQSSFLVSGRRTYLDMFLPLSPDEDIHGNQLFFYDTNFKLNWITNDNNRFFLSGYLGRDVFKNEYAGLDFGNKTLTLRWNHLFSPRLFSNATLVFSRYDYLLESTGDAFSSINWDSRLNDFSLKYAFTYYPRPEDLLEFGLQSIYHAIKPGDVSSYDENQGKQLIEVPKANALEHAAYISHTRKISPQLSIRVGLRFSLFQNIGKGRSFRYNDSFIPVDTLNYSKGHLYNQFAGIEPRLGFSWLLSPQITLKGSYANNRQYLHLASNSGSGTPLDIWFVSSPNIQPQISHQLAGGLHFNSRDKIWEHSLELFVKKVYNAIDFKDYPDLILNEALEGEVRPGQALAKGVEWLTKYNRGHLNGWFAYTLSESKRYSRWINNGSWYLSPFDHTHNLSIVVNYALSPRLHLSANWLYFTGTPTTYPVGRFDFQGGIIPVYSKRNAERMPDYHRMDVALVLQGKNPPSRAWQSEWSFSVYNLYGRKNAWMINFTGNDDEDPYTRKAEKTYLFSVVPSVSYIIRF